jgi:outer membrane assembly lipoprotein YfiO
MLSNRIIPCFSFLMLALLPGCKNRSYKQVTVTTPQPLTTSRITEHASEFSTVVEKKSLRPHFKKLAERDLLYKQPKDMALAELYSALDYALKIKNNDQAIKFVERLLIVESDQEKVRLLRLQLADLYFDNGNLKKAGAAYSEYIKLYPGGKDQQKEERDYAEYKGILCRFYARLRPPLDQSKTRKTLSLAKNYLRSSGTHTYQEDVKKIQHECYRDLFNYEKGIVKFYCHQGSLQAAQERLKEMKKEFGGLASFDPKIIKLEMFVARKEGNMVLAQAKQQELETKFPEYLLKSTHRLVKQNHVNRF